MAKLLFITHPEVEADPARPVARWVLSAPGIARMRAEGPQTSAVGAIFSSGEAKANEAAGGPSAAGSGSG